MISYQFQRHDADTIEAIKVKDKKAAEEAAKKAAAKMAASPWVGWKVMSLVHKFSFVSQTALLKCKQMTIDFCRRLLQRKVQLKRKKESR